MVNGHPLTIFRILKGGCPTYVYTQTRGSSFGPSVKKPTSWARKGGGGRPLPPGSAPDMSYCEIKVCCNVRY